MCTRAQRPLFVALGWRSAAPGVVGAPPHSPPPPPPAPVCRAVAAKAKVPVVPITLVGTGDLMPNAREYLLFPGKVKVCAGGAA